MRLSDLAAYASEKYHITEQYKWAEYPGYSVLVDPYTEKWAALLMRRWDPNRGEEIELCDIWCGQEVLDTYREPYLSSPFRMHGEFWVGVRFDSSTDPDVVRQLFDRAMQARRLHGFTIILDNTSVPQGSQYQDTPIRFGGGASSSRAPLPYKRASSLLQGEPVPKEIRDMRLMYRYGDGSFRQKCKNFYMQGKFMEDYEDDLPWHGEFRQYFPTYHDMNVLQLRGFFTWRTKVRKGSYERACESFAYMYLYELLNGIGADDMEDRLRKMQAFERGFLDAGFGSEGMRRALHRWALELAVIGGMDASVARQYMDSELMERDEALMILRTPEERDDDELFRALCTIGGSKIRNSTLIQKTGKEAERLFAAVWRYASRHYQKNRKDLFTACFDVLKEHPWHPLANTVFWQQKPVIKAEYELNEVHRFTCWNTVWKECCYSTLFYNKTCFEGLMHETDRRLRIYLKFGHPLKEFIDDAWAAAFIDAVIDEDRKAKAEAHRPKIRIRFEDLEKIRQDASVTRDSLLTEEETEEEKREDKAAQAGTAAAEANTSGDVLSLPLNASQIRILTLLLQGSSVKGLLRSQHAMPEVFADELNEAFYDLIGDTVVSCDGEELSLIEDYRDDVVRLLGGNTE